MSIADKINRLTTARNNIRTALSGQGVSASSHNFEDFATDIASISGGSLDYTSALLNTKNHSISFSVDAKPIAFCVICDDVDFTSMSASYCYVGAIGGYQYGTGFDNQMVYSYTYNSKGRMDSTGNYATVAYNNGTLTLNTNDDYIYFGPCRYLIFYVY